MASLSNIYRLGLKELQALRYDPVLGLLIVYLFTYAVYAEARGVLKGFDQLVNIVLDDCVEEMHDPDDPYKKTDERRRLGLVVCRGLQVSLVSPVDGMEEIANPFIQQEEEVV